MAEDEEIKKDKVVIDWSNIEEYSLVPIEYRFVDKCEVIPGKEARGLKAVSSQDWYFKIHFPGNPVMPGVFLMEAMQQTGLLIVSTMPEFKDKLMMFQGCKAMRIFKPVRPGDVIHMYVSLLSYRMGVAVFHGEVKRDDGEREVLVCSMNFTMVSQNETVRIQKEEDTRGGIIDGEEIDWLNIDMYLADPIGYRFIDKAFVIPGKQAHGRKTASMLDWYFSIGSHGGLAMPECLLLEALMQTGVLVVTTMPDLKDNLMMFHSCDSYSLYGFVRPGDSLQTRATLISYRRGVAKYHAEAANIECGNIICEADFTLISPNTLIKI